jgi:hypothetical protein
MEHKTSAQIPPIFDDAWVLVSYSRINFDYA